MSSRIGAMTRLLGFARRYRLLLSSTLIMGVLGFAVTFVFPCLIGTIVDKVISPQHLDATERWKSLTFLIIVGAITALLSSIAVYGRGHLSVKLGNRIIADLRRDTFDHL